MNIYMNLNQKLQKIYDTVLMQIKPEEFAFDSYVSNGLINQKNTVCGTVCCVVGWFPKYFPKSGFTWKENQDKNSKTKIILHHDHGKVKNALKHILQCDECVVFHLFFPYHRLFFYNQRFKELESIRTSATLEEVKTIWKNAINSDLSEYDYSKKIYFLD